jgi:HlyD family type I secretion membrane fusion protein
MPKPASKPKANTVPYILVGLTIVLVMFGGLGTWASLARLDGAVVAPGVVTVFSKRKTVQHLEGGIVSQILVRDGDTAESGQLLIRLDDTRARASLAILDGQLNVLRARQSRLQAERDGAGHIEFDAALYERKDSPNVANILRGEVELFEARRASIHGEIEILKQRIAQIKEQIAGLTSQQKAEARQINLIREELKGLNVLYERGYAPKTRILALKRTAEQVRGERAEHIADIARAKNSIGETKLQIIQVEKKARQEVVQELREVQAEVFDLEERRVAAADELQRVEIRAPRTGTVVGMDVHTIGGVIGPGQAILDIVPEKDELVIEAQVAPQDIDKVTDGLEAVVRLSAFNMRTTPELGGKVFMASADRMIDEVSGEPYYLLGVRVPDSERSKLKDLELLPGMPAEVFVNTGERTALSYLVKPFTDALARTFKED